MTGEWSSVRTLPPLRVDELQLWQINLADAAGREDIYKRHLPYAELERADRFRKSDVRLQFITARAALRVLLGTLLHLSPNLVPITSNPYGKPETPAVNGLDLFFNVAHSRATILIGLCRASHLGVDVEYIDSATNFLEIARNSFASSEVDMMMKIGDPLEQRRTFFRCWARKEAVIKADGRGLSVPLNFVEVPVTGPVASAPIFIKEEFEKRDNNLPWFVSDVVLGQGIAAAVAVRIPHLKPSTFHFPLALLEGE